MSSREFQVLPIALEQLLQVHLIRPYKLQAEQIAHYAKEVTLFKEPAQSMYIGSPVAHFVFDATARPFACHWEVAFSGENIIVNIAQLKFRQRSGIIGMASRRAEKHVQGLR